MRHLAVVYAAFFFLLAYFFPHPELNAPFGWTMKLYDFALSMSFFAAVYALGLAVGSYVLRLAFQEAFFLSPAIGSCLFTLLAAALGHAGLIGPGYRGLWVGLAGLLGAVGLWACAALEWPVRIRPRWSGLERLALFYFVLLLALKLLEGFQLQSVGDPFSYHLAGPRYWYQVGQVRWTDDFAVLFQTGFWEYFNLWIFELIGGVGSQGLIAGQHAAQWAITALGLTAVVGGSYWIAARLAANDRKRAALATIVVMSVTLFTNFSHTSKNDTGSLAWIFSGIALSLFPSPLAWPAFAGGLLIGAGVSAKFTAGLLALPWTLAWLLLAAKNARRVLCYLAGLSLPMIPVLARNLAGTGNPFFPSLNGIFRSPKLLPSWANYLSGFQGGHWDNGRFQTFREEFTHLLLTNHLWALAGCLLLFRLARGPAPDRRLACLRIVPFLSFALFAYAMGNNAELRLGAPTVLLLSLVIADEIYAFASRHLPGSYAAWVAWGIAVASIAVSHLPLYAVSHAFRYGPSNLEIHKFTGAASKDAVRRLVPTTDRVYIDDAEFYYLLYRDIALTDALFEGICGLRPDDTVQRVQQCLADTHPRWLLMKKGSDYGRKVAALALLAPSRYQVRYEDAIAELIELKGGVSPATHH